MLRDRLDPIGNPRQIAKELRQLRIDPLAEGQVAVEQVLGRVVIKPFFGPQILQELLERAFEFDLLDDRLHFLPDASDLGQTDRVNLVRREIRRREMAGPEGIEFLPAWKLPRADLVEAGWKILVVEELGEG